MVKLNIINKAGTVSYFHETLTASEGLRCISKKSLQNDAELRILYKKSLPNPGDA